MAVRDIFKVSRKTFFNPSAWIDLEALIDQNKTIFSIIKNLFSKPVAGTAETFDEAIKRQKVSEAEIANRITTYGRFAALYVLCGLAAFVYAFYLLFRHHTFLGFCLSFSVTIFFFAQAFAYDFWKLQLKRRTLGLTFADWKKSWLGE